MEEVLNWEYALTLLGCAVFMIGLDLVISAAVRAKRRKAERPKRCKHEATIYSMETEVTRCAYCGDVLHHGEFNH